MFAEFNWWLLIVGLVVGAGLAWLVLADARRREDEIAEAELAEEAVWLERAMAEAGNPVDAATAEELLRLHRAYLGVAPSDPIGPETDDLDAPGSAREATLEPPSDEPIPDAVPVGVEAPGASAGMGRAEPAPAEEPAPGARRPNDPA